MSVKGNSSVVHNSLPQSLTIITQVTLPAADSKPAKKKKKKLQTKEAENSRRLLHILSVFLKKEYYILTDTCIFKRL